jgi:hypothetical protein
MGAAKIRGKLTSRIGRPTHFGAPRDVKQKGGKEGYGRIIDEVWTDETLNDSEPHQRPCHWGAECWGDYSFCSQLIEWVDGTRSIRLAYYRRRCGEDHWEYASQTTVNSEWLTIKVLLEKTLAKTAWFQEPRKET